jgi:regulatory protein
MAWAFISPCAGTFVTTTHSGPSLKGRALRMLARREHSRAELHRKLERFAAEGDDVDAVLDDLAARGWLSDARFAELAIRARSARFGPLRLAQQLRSRGVAEETISAGFRAAGEEGASDIAKVWGSRFHELPADERERGRQVRFLQGRGFALEAVFRFFKSMEASR